MTDGSRVNDNSDLRYEIKEILKAKHNEDKYKLPVYVRHKSNYSFCPECGASMFIHIEACARCINCGFTECK